jgi:hypothetical protein
VRIKEAALSSGREAKAEEACAVKEAAAVAAAGISKR